MAKFPVKDRMAVGLALVPAVIFEAISVSQSKGFVWNWLSITALSLLGVYVVFVLWYFSRNRTSIEPPEVSPPQSFPPNSLIARKLVNNEGGKIVGVNVFTDETDNSGLIAHDFPPPPPPVLDLSGSHDISFAHITFEAKGTVLKAEDSYNISMQDVQINQRDEKEGETPITS